MGSQWVIFWGLIGASAIGALTYVGYREFERRRDISELEHVFSTPLPSFHESGATTVAGAYKDYAKRVGGDFHQRWEPAVDHFFVGQSTRSGDAFLAGRDVSAAAAALASGGARCVAGVVYRTYGHVMEPWPGHVSCRGDPGVVVIP